MNQDNTLADVAVPKVFAGFDGMFNIQLKLQERLNQLPVQPIDWHETAKRVIYWGHCINAETVELVDWIEKTSNPDWLKELQMEAIDIVHFVFNIAITLDLPVEDIVDCELEFSHSTWELDGELIDLAIEGIRNDFVDLVNLLPWKTWKTYNTQVHMTSVRAVYRRLLSSTLLLCNYCELHRQDIIDMFYAKNNVNHTRQDNGY